MDKRIIKTRKNILDVFLKLLEEKPVNEISAQEIAELAEISRSTFYQHYSDVYNLLDQAEDDIFDEITDLLEGYTYETVKSDPLQLFTALFHYFKHNAKICVVLLNKNGSITTGQRISKMIEGKFQHEWEALIKCDDKKMAHYLSQYAISGFVGILQTWIKEGMQDSVEDIALIARNLMSSSINLKTEDIKNQSYKMEVTKMSSLKDKIRGDAKKFAGGILNDTSGFLNEKTAEIQAKVEAGLSTAGSKLAQKGADLQSAENTKSEDPDATADNTQEAQCIEKVQDVQVVQNKSPLTDDEKAQKKQLVLNKLAKLVDQLDITDEDLAELKIQG